MLLLPCFGEIKIYMTRKRRLFIISMGASPFPALAPFYFLYDEEIK